jgi:ubiquinone/menaquinone biosynthesis C-methylase UbiE
LEGEKKRLALMSGLLDPMHRRHIESLGISRDARVLEVGCGDGSMSAWMAKHIAPDGQIVALPKPVTQPQAWPGFPIDS